MSEWRGHITLDVIMDAITALQRSMDARFDKLEAHVAAEFKKASDDPKDKARSIGSIRGRARY